MSKEVQMMFSRIAHRYDRANDVLSMGIHRLWRHTAIDFGGIEKGETVLDLCTGTGDFAFALAKSVGQTGRIIGVDFVDAMLELAEEKKSRLASPESIIEFICGDALAIPLPDASVDAVTIGFGIRNVDDMQLCFREIGRVLRPEGRAIILEFGQVTIPGLSTLYNAYSTHIIPKIGELVTGNREAYEYLPKTASTFPAGDEFLRHL